MPSPREVRALLAQGLDHGEVGRRLGIPAGQVEMIATGVPADGSDALTAAEREDKGVPASTQHLLGVPVHNPTSRKAVHEWISARVAADTAMRAAQQRHDQQNQEG
ncbi:hypothetical protein ACFQH9_01865 [Pseudonocardia lutea]|jgi:hypothetical protein|uniref:Uncharacterized protein n=1 Tax=Pseudonocardia lutea TaxID=2172015 RepID=A0ABW1I000_9PSEU